MMMDATINDWASPCSSSHATTSAIHRSRGVMCASAGSFVASPEADIGDASGLAAVPGRIFDEAGNRGDSSGDRETRIATTSIAIALTTISTIDRRLIFLSEPLTESRAIQEADRAKYLALRGTTSVATL